MAKIELKDYQKEAVRMAVKVPYNAVYVMTGQGKSVISVFYSRCLINKNLADKVILCSTKTGVNSFQKAFGKRAGIEVPQYDKEEDILNFFVNDEKLCIIKHSMIEKLGFTKANIDFIRKGLSDNYRRIAIVIDECHKFSNDTTNLHQAFMNIRFAFERISLHTATPIGSTLETIYGLTHLIYPKLWRSKREFIDNYIEERIIRDYRTHRIVRKETVAYHNLADLRQKILPFTYFYYPEVDLVFVEHKAKLKSYTEYYDLCDGLLGIEDLKEGK